MSLYQLKFLTKFLFPFLILNITLKRHQNHTTNMITKGIYFLNSISIRQPHSSLNNSLTQLLTLPSGCHDLGILLYAPGSIGPLRNCKYII